ncbi:MAG TPA: hypothetical protein VLW53_17250 [Candidatus Eisenbacteria bacterium]|nr:hypothetical protein [Candidatus Eisenbacteria bacterium]
MAGDGGVAAAIPAELIHWPGWASGLNSNLRTRGDLLDMAVAALARSAPDPGILQLGAEDHMGGTVVAFAARNQATDQWVGQVGWAFFRAATKGLPPGLVRADREDLLNGTVTATDGQVAASAPDDPHLQVDPIPTDLARRRAWWAKLGEADRQLYLQVAPADVAYLATAGELTEAGFASLEDVYVRQSFIDAGIDPGLWDPGRGLKANDGIVQAVYAYYQHLWDANHDLQWAGMAKLAGATVYAGMQDLYVVSQLPRDRLVQLATGGHPLAQLALAIGTGEVTYFEDTFLRMQKDIFMDLGWQHTAYAHGGRDAIDALHRDGLLTGDNYLAWQDISSGDASSIATGNLLLLRREQHDVIQPTYDQLRSRHWIEGRLFTDFLSENARSPIPGGKPFKDVVGTHVDLFHIGPLTVGWETADVTNFSDRWKWITRDMLPKYQQLLRDPAQAEQVIDTPLSARAPLYRDLPELHVDGY